MQFYRSTPLRGDFIIVTYLFRGATFSIKADGDGRAHRDLERQPCPPLQLSLDLCDLAVYSGPMDYC